MKRKLHVATLGFYANEMVEYVLLKRGADKIVLVYTIENEIQFILLRKDLTARGMTVIPCIVNPWKFELTLACILEEVTKHSDSIFEFHASCGTRVMSAAVQVAALLTESPILFVERELGGTLGEIIEIEPASFDKLTVRKREILNGIQKLGGKATQKDLIRLIGLQRSGLSKHLKGLLTAGYITLDEESHPKNYKISYLGRIIISLKQFRKTTMWNK